jgi:hypothetical protein
MTQLTRIFSACVDDTATKPDQIHPHPITPDPTACECLDCLRSVVAEWFDQAEEPSMTLSESLRAEEAHCHERLAEIRLRCDRESKPWIDILTRIKAMEVPTYFLPTSEIPELVNLQRQTAPIKSNHETFDDYGIKIIPNPQDHPGRSPRVHPVVGPLSDTEK